MLLKKWKRKLNFADHMVTLELIILYFFERKNHYVHSNYNNSGP